MSAQRFFIVAAVLLICAPLVSSHALYLSLDFGLDNQTYNWADSLLVERQLNDTWNLQVANRSTATLIRESVFGGGEDRWQKLARSVGRLNRQLSQSVFAGIELRQNFERLEKRRYIGNSAYLTTDVDVDNLKLSQKGGVVWEHREYASEGSVQSGLGYESLVSLRPRDDGSFGELNLEGNITTLKETPRKSLKLGYNLQNSFTGSDTTSLSLSQEFGETKYFPISSDFETTARQRNEQRQFDFDTRRALPSTIYLRARAAYHLTSYDYEYNNLGDGFFQQSDNVRSLFEYRLDLSRWFDRYLYLESEYLFNRSKEDFGRQQVNQRSETGQLAVTARLLFMGSDTLEASGKVGVTSYEAPSGSEIYSDRDRSIQVASFRVAHYFTRFLRASVDGSFRGFHTIYISGSLSANNNINNIYILNPTLVWQPWSHLTIEHNYQLHADYIYYDYEKSSLAGRNTIYRRANFMNTFILNASPHTDLTFEYSYRYEDFGPIRYTDQWQQQVSWDRRTHRPKFGLDYHPNRNFRFRPYAVYEIQRYYDHLFDPDNTLGRREQTEEFVRTLVGFELELALAEASYIECKLERRVQEYQNQRNQDYDLFTVAIKKRI